MIQRLLRSYFALNSEYGYCEFYTQPDCCKSFPCAKSDKIKFSKNHDDNLDLPQLQNLRYLIQYRNFQDSVVSNFELHVFEKNGPDTALEFRKYVSIQWGLYLGFKDKWVTSQFAKSQLVIDYDELIEDPAATLKSVIRWFAPDAVIDEEKIVEVTKSADGIGHKKTGEIVSRSTGIKSTRIISEFRFFDPKLFQLIRELVLKRSDVLKTHRKLLGRPPHESSILEMQTCDSVHSLQKVLSRENK